MENERKDEGKNAYGDEESWTRHLECDFLQDKCRESPLENSQITQDET